jgi:IS1 family transposase
LGLLLRQGKNVAPENKGILGYGDVYTWTGMDADTKLMVSYMVGKRDAEYAHAFIDDLASRLANRVQLTTDGHKPYLAAVEQSFHGAIDYAILNKLYGEAPKEDRRRYSLTEYKGVVSGNPDPKHISTSFVERQNLTMRMGMRRFTRLTNGFSKKVANLEHAASLHFMHYNFCRIHKTLRVTPAMAAGVTDHVRTGQPCASACSQEARAVQEARPSGSARRNFKLRHYRFFSMVGSSRRRNPSLANAQISVRYAPAPPAQ